MNRNTAIALVAVCCLAVTTAVFAQGGDASSKLLQLEKDMHHAQMTNDAAWFQQHVADGFVEGFSWGVWADKAEAIKEIKDNSVKFNSGEITDVKVASFGPNVAVAHYTFTYDATFSGTHRARSVICSDTWISQSGAWKMAANHCSHVEGK